MNSITKLFFSLLLLFVVATQVSLAQSKQTDPEKRIKELNITLQAPGTPIANFVPAVTVGKLVFVSGHGPIQANGEFLKGKVGRDLDVDQAKAAARLTAITLLGVLKSHVGGLNKVKRIVKVLGMVNATADFDQHPQVMNGFSDLMVEVFGENGRHARSAVGMGSLPMGIPVEIEMIVELK